jgi:hypothetical protein
LTKNTKSNKKNKLTTVKLYNKIKNETENINKTENTLKMIFLLQFYRILNISIVFDDILVLISKIDEVTELKNFFNFNLKEYLRLNKNIF